MNFDAPPDRVEPALEYCDECGFDGALWSRADALNTIDWIGPLAALAAEGVPTEMLATRPSPLRWSIIEYLDHVADVLTANRTLVQIAVEHDGHDVGDLPDDRIDPEVPPLELGKTLTRIDAAAVAYREAASVLTDAGFAAAVVLGGDRHSVSWSLPHVLHDTMHHVADIASIRRDLGDAPSAGHGVVTQLNTSGGGVPKHAVEMVEVGRRGLVGDRQRTRRHHGRPWQALCLYSAEVIAALRAEGHPISAGSTGENVTISGLDWSALRPGVGFVLGDVRARLTLPAEPCSKIGGSFLGRDFGRIQHAAAPGWSRWYAEVLDGGRVRAGDPVRVES